MTRDDVIRMAREAGASFDPRWGLAYNVGTATFERFAALVAAAEREACAKVCDIYALANSESDIMADAFNHCSAAIRERGEGK